MSSRVELTQAGPEHQRRRENLLELYIHDFSEFVSVDVSEDGRFGYPDLHLYWCEPRRMPFLAKIEGKLVGFALVTRGPRLCADSEVWDVAEFFVLRRYRSRGVGAEIAEKIWILYTGIWQIRFRSANLEGLNLSESTIDNVSQSAIAY